MKQLNSYRFYELGAKLHALFGAESGARATALFAPLSEAQALLDSFIKGDVISLSTSKSDAVKLLNKIGAIFNRYFIDPATRQLKAVEGEERIDTHELAMLHALVEKFEHALAAELNRAPTYVAGKRGIYSTYDLAENAEEIFSESLRAAIPVASQNEFTAAGRALAYGLGTAATMHVLRAVEAMLRGYYENFAGASPAKNERNYAAYLKKLAAMAEEDDRAVRPDRRVVQMLAQLKDHYRNPLVAADATVSIDEATQVFGMASAIISLMAEAVAAGRRSAGGSAGEGVGGGASSSVPPASAVPPMIDEDRLYDFRMKEAG
ncbi:MAG: hypothetical protein KGI37_02485 [Alphaproteobacteria bacterium]|nr:hypothetical protein [Alphaproteobacteria bacterium]